jgi:hypothetical protein
MLGRFLEVALVTADTGPAWQQLQKLGFEPAATGDIWPHAYGVVACEGLAIGLHAKGDEPFSVVFVRPEVAALHRELAARGIEVERAQLGSDVFNELWLRDPDGTALRVLEARTFSPPAQLPPRTALGSFASLSLPCRHLDAARDFWQSLGRECIPVEDPWQGLSIAGTPLSCHPHGAFPKPVLIFRHDGRPEPLAIDGGAPALRASLPSLPGRQHVFSRSIEGLAVLVLVDG